MEVIIEKVETARVKSIYGYRFNNDELDIFNETLENNFKAFEIEDYELITFEEAVDYLQGETLDKFEKVYFSGNKYRVPFTIGEMFDYWIDEQLMEDPEPEIIDRGVDSSDIDVTILD